MHCGADFPPVNPGALDAGPYSIDFVNDVPSGVTISTALVTISVLQGTDSNPMNLIAGSNPSQIQGTIVTQLLRNFQSGNIYIFSIDAVGTDGNSYNLYAYIPCLAVYS